MCFKIRYFAKKKFIKTPTFRCVGLSFFWSNTPTETYKSVAILCQPAGAPAGWCADTAAGTVDAPRPALADAASAVGATAPPTDDITCEE